MKKLDLKLALYFIEDYNGNEILDNLKYFRNLKEFSIEIENIKNCNYQSGVVLQQLFQSLTSMKIIEKLSLSFKGVSFDDNIWKIFTQSCKKLNTLNHLEINVIDSYENKNVFLNELAIGISEIPNLVYLSIKLHGMKQFKQLDTFFKNIISTDLHTLKMSIDLAKMSPEAWK